MEEILITGTIEQGDTKVAFIGEDFKFTFITCDEKVTLEVDKCGYVWGKTHDNKAIAIFVQRSFRVYHTKVVHTWNYIVSKGNLSFNSMKRFRGIRFENGAIRTVFPCNALREVFDVEDKIRKEEKRTILAYEQFPDVKEFRISSKDFDSIKKVEKGKYKGIDSTWIFASKIEQRISINEGHTLKNTTSTLDITFDDDKDYSTFYDFYGYVRTILSFMTFRKEVGFDKVFLLQEFPEDGMLNAYAECFVKKPEGAEESRSHYEIIAIGTVSDDIFKNLFISTVLHDGKYGEGEYAALPITILPAKRQDIMIFAPEKIKDVCSCLEVELDAVKINCEKSDELIKLVNSVKDTVKAHRDGDNALEESTYSQIFGNIKNWGDSLADRIVKAWNKYKTELDPFVKNSGIILDTEQMDKSILEMVKTRNAMTHRGFYDYDEEVAETAFLMYGLVFAMAIARIGLPREYITALMDRRFIV